MASFLSPGFLNIFFYILVFDFWRFATVPGYYILTSLLCSPVLLFSFCFPSVTLPIILSLSLSLCLFLLPFIIHLLLPPIFIHHPASLSALNRCLYFLHSPYFSQSLPHFLLLFCLFVSYPFSHSPSVIMTSISFSLLYDFPLLSLPLPLSCPLKTPQPCRRLRGWTMQWSEVWWLLLSSSCSASSSSSADTSSDTKVICSHVHT